MKRAACILVFLAVLGAGGMSAVACAAESRAVTSTPVELPPMLVEESTSSVPWLYVNVGGTEYLSRCSASTTREFISAVLAKSQLVRVIVPEEFLARTDVPEVIVLYAQELKQTVSAEIQRELQGPETRSGEPGVNIAPNMRLSDRDMHASIVYIDEALFDGSTLSLSPGHVRYMLQRRVPELPGWVVDGVERAWQRADFVLEPITFGPVVWQGLSESEAIASDETRPRALLTAGELFATEAQRAMESRHPRRQETRAATQELFFRWAMAQGDATRAAYWKLAARAAQGALNEEVFEATFGFDYAELRDRLSDYLPVAVEETNQIEPGDLPALPRFEVERATPNQIARVRGEWERLAIGHVQRRLPRAREPYIAQARRTLRRAYDGGDRDPRLLATMGLCEIDAGNEAGAREFLEPAIAAGVIRPRAYYEVARLRFAELRRGVPEEKIFSFTELAPIFQPLENAQTQAPPLAEVFTLLGEAWARCETTPNATESTALVRGAQLFGRRPAVAVPIAKALARHGRRPEAAAVLDGCAGASVDDATRATIAQLRTEMSGASPAAAGER